MLYVPSVSDATVAKSTITGRNIAHAHRSNIERAFLGADLHLDRITLISPTIKQCSVLVGACRPYIAAAVAIANNPDARAAVLSGDVLIIDAAKSMAAETIAAHFARTTPDEWLEAARVLGPSVVWEQMVAPLV